MVVRSRIRSVALVVAFILMIAAILYIALNRSHEVAPAAPMHQAR